MQVRQPCLSITNPPGQGFIHFKYRHVSPEIKSSSCCYIITFRGVTVEEGKLRGGGSVPLLVGAEGAQFPFLKNSCRFERGGRGGGNLPIFLQTA